MKEHLKDIFREESSEQLTLLENTLLELEDGRGEPELVNEVFRILHTIKGSAAMFGLGEIAGFAHKVESVLDLVRSGQLPVSSMLVTQVLRSGDIIRRMLLDDHEGCSKEVAEVMENLQGLAAHDHSNAELHTPADAVAGKKYSGPLQTFRIHFAINPSLMEQGSNPLDLIRELSALGPCRITANMDAIPKLTDIDASLSYVEWDIILTTAAGENAVRDIFIFVEGECRLLIEPVCDEMQGVEDHDVTIPCLGEILVERGDLDRESLARALSGQKMLGEILVESGELPVGRLNAALSEQNHLRELQRNRHTRESAVSLRVPAVKLDQLVNLVGELVTAQGGLSLCAGEFNSLDLFYQRDAEKLFEDWDRIGGMLRNIAEDVERLTLELRETAMNLRVLPIGATFGRYRRLIRDLAANLGKEVELITEGEETELDKNVIERLADPLLHIIRNSIDHGIETPEVRLSAGKEAKGTVFLSASHIGDRVEIRISDNGAGLNPELIRATAVGRGLISNEADLDDHELYAFICEPGFSTSSSVSDISGRGVGMDVVRQAIEALHGTLEINSLRGSGTTMIIRLPLTLAIIETLLVRVGEVRYMIPLSQVEECIDLTREELAASHGRDIVSLRGEPVPFVLMRERFRIAGERPEIEQVVVTRFGRERYGLVVDEVLCQYQSVIKSLGRFYQKVDGVSGATILGDGSVALVLDISGLLSDGNSGLRRGGAVLVA